MSPERVADGVVALIATKLRHLEFSGIFTMYIYVLLAIFPFKELQDFVYKRPRFLCSLTICSEDTFVTLV